MNKAFTLIEILVAVAIFSLVIGTTSGLFVSAFRIQRKSLAQQELLAQASYVLDYMTRTIRMAKKEQNCLDLADPTTCSQSNPPYCLTNNGYGFNYEITRQGKGLKFISTEKVCQEFFLEGTRLKEAKDGQEEFLTSDKLQLEVFGLTLTGESQGDNLQPLVTLFLKIKGRGVGERPELTIQTSVSQRDLDIYVE